MKYFLWIYKNNAVSLSYAVAGEKTVCKVTSASGDVLSSLQVEDKIVVCGDRPLKSCTMIFSVLGSNELCKELEVRPGLPYEKLPKSVNDKIDSRDTDLVQITEAEFAEIANSMSNSVFFRESKGIDVSKKPDVFQKIVFGAPGTGKSYSLNEDALASFGKIAYSKEQRIELFKQSKFIDSAKNYNTFIGKNILEEYGFDAYAEDSLAILNKKLQELETLKKTSKDDQNLYHNLTNRCSALKAYIKFTETIFVDSIERVTFHPNYSYAQFVGTYKPVSSGYNGDLTDEEVRHVVNILQDSSKSGQEKYDLLYDGFKSDGMLTRLPLLLGLYSDDTFSTKKKDGTAASGDNEVERNHGQAIRPYVTLGINEGISYKYVPGPFMRTLVKALNNPQKDFLLIIEEINRANVAVVFGDVFQLLDRKNGVSEYPVAASEDIKRYLKDNGIADCNELKIPSNMYIWATMNSADQGVFPMDTAFKRRWEFEYIGVDDNQQMIENFEIPMQKNADGSHEWMKWNELRTKINDKLTDLGINEDKLLGPFFISLEKLQSVDNHNESEAENFVKAFKSKVLMYLFEDAVKMKAPSFFKCDKMRYSEICKKFDTDGIEVFNF